MSGCYQVISKKRFTILDGKAHFELEGVDGILDYLSKISNEDTAHLVLTKHRIISKIKSGVYVFVIKNIITGEIDCAYVGCSINISSRLQSHEVCKMLINGTCDYFEISIYIIPTENYISLEKEVIKRLNPFLNHEYSPNKRQDVIHYSLPKRKNWRYITPDDRHYITIKKELNGVA